MSKAAIIYWSGTGNTKAMAQAIYDGMTEKGADAQLFEVSAAPADLSAFGTVAFGCPSMGAEVLEESEFEPYFTRVEASLAGKKVALFGSYGWGDGEWMRNWYDRAKATKANLFDEGLIMQDAPDEAACKTHGKQLAAF